MSLCFSSDGNRQDWDLCWDMLRMTRHNIWSSLQRVPTRLLPLVWVCMIRTLFYEASMFWRLSCLLLHYCKKILKVEAALLLGVRLCVPAEALKGISRVCPPTWSLHRTCLTRSGWGEEPHGTREATVYQAKCECQGEGKQVWEEGRFDREEVVAWTSGCHHL